MKKENRIIAAIRELGAKIRRHLDKKLLFGLLAAAGSLILFLWLADEVFEGATKVFDENIRQAIHGWATPWLTQIAILLSLGGSVVFLLIVSVVILIVFLRLKWKHAAALFLITMAGELLLEIALKLFFQRVRPEPFFNYPLPLSFSFPSGHALGSFCFYGILAWLTAARIENRGGQALIWILAAALVLLIGVSRVYLGVHFPSDVLAGFTAGFVWTLAVALSDFLFGRERAEN